MTRIQRDRERERDILEEFEEILYKRVAVTHLGLQPNYGMSAVFVFIIIKLFLPNLFKSNLFELGIRKRSSKYKFEKALLSIYSNLHQDNYHKKVVKIDTSGCRTF